MSLDVVELIHAGLMIGQLSSGLLFSGSPMLWLRCFLEVASFLCVSITVLMVAADFLFSFMGERLQADPKPAKRLAEYAESMRAMAVFAGFAAWPRLLFVQHRPTALHFSLAAAQPEAPTSLALYVGKLLLVTLLVDAYMYFKHRALHLPSLFRFHKQHHAFVSPTPFAAFAVAPVEAALTFAPVLALCLPEAPVWAHAYGVWTACFVLLNLYLHSGVSVSVFEGLRSVGLNSAEFHDRHHESGGSVNFGELCFIWDYFLGTGAHPVRTSKTKVATTPRARRQTR